MKITYKILGFFLTLFILVVSCNGINSAKIQNAASNNNFRIPLIIDTLQKTEELKRTYSINISEPRIEAYKPFSDTCLITDEGYNMWDSTINRMVDQRADGLQLLVDTTQYVTLKYDKDFDFYRLDDTTQTYYKGYPCFIYNETSTIKWLRMQDSRIIVIQEAMDSNYTWRPIQIWQWSWCGNSYSRAYIKPNHYALFKTPLYEGKYYTELRLKLHSKDAVYYSNTYKGFINYNQFSLPKVLMNMEGNPGFNLSFLTND